MWLWQIGKVFSYLGIGNMGSDIDQENLAW
jgi:hypothetical protein